MHDSYEKETASSSDVTDTITALTLRTKERSTKYKMARYDIRNVSMKDLVNKIIEFEKFVKVPNFKKEPKHEPTVSYLHLVECLQKCIMRSDDHKQHVHDSYESVRSEERRAH